MYKPLTIVILSLFFSLGLVGSQQAPVISGVKVDAITHSSARLYWETDVPSTTNVLYGLTNAYGLSNNGGGSTTKHSWFLAGLKPDTTYFFCPQSTAIGTSTCDGTTNNFSFRTLALPSAHPAPPELPRSTVNVAEPIVNGTTLTVSGDCSDLQAKIQTLAGLDGNLTHKLIMPKGTVCNSHYSLPAKFGVNAAGDGWLIITSNGKLPVPGTRVLPADKPELATFRNMMGPVKQNGSLSAPCNPREFGWDFWKGIENNGTLALFQCNDAGDAWVAVANVVSGTQIPDSCAFGSWFYKTDGGGWHERLYGCFEDLKFTRVILDWNGGVNSSFQNAAIFKTEANSHHWRMEGLEFTQPKALNPESSWVTMNYFYSDPTSHDIILDRNYVHGLGYPNKVWYGLFLNGKNVAAVNNYFNEIHQWTNAGTVDTESHAIYSYGPGPARIENNSFINVIGITVYFPGDTSVASNQYASDVEIRGNYFYKSERYIYGNPANVENKLYQTRHHLELKRGRRFLVEGNIFDGNWAHINQGALIALTTRGTPTTEAPTGDMGITDITFRNNVLRNAPNGIILLAHDDHADNEQQIETARLSFTNNLFYNIDGTKWYTPVGSGGCCTFGQAGSPFWLFWGIEDVTVTHNTVYRNIGTNPKIISFQEGGTAASEGFSFKDNIVYSTIGLPMGKDGGPAQRYGIDALNYIFQASGGYEWQKNVIVPFGSGALTPESANMPLTDLWTALEADAQSQAGFIDALNGNFGLLSSSPFKGKASDGKDPGVDLALLSAAIANTVSGGRGSISIPTPSPTPTPSPSPTPTPLPSPSPTPQSSPSPTVCTMTVNSPILPQWGSGKLVVNLSGFSSPAIITATASTGQVSVSAPQTRSITGSSAIVEFGIQTKKKSSSVIVNGPCGSQTVVVTVR